MRAPTRPSRSNHAPTTSASPPRNAAAIAIACICCASLAAGAIGCLPGDTRPIPERVHVTAEPGQGLTQGIDTADGWHITFDRFLLALGNLDFENDDVTCNSYAEARYDRLFDFTVAGREKLGTVYGLGTCRIEFRLRAPSFDALIGPGATASDVPLMRIEAADHYQMEQGRVSLLVLGAASRGEEKKQFFWMFRRSYELTNCEAPGGGYLTTVELTEASSSELRIEVRAEELFRAAPDDSAPLLFQPMADADTNADGYVIFEELALVPMPVVETGELGEGAASGGGGAGGAGPSDAGTPDSLEALVYRDLLPRVLRVAGGGPCEIEDRR
jgi:hypothetical protein